MTEEQQTDALIERILSTAPESFDSNEQIAALAVAVRDALEVKHRRLVQYALALTAALDLVRQNKDFLSGDARRLFAELEGVLKQPDTATPTEPEQTERDRLFRNAVLEEAARVCEEEAALNAAAGWSGRNEGAYQCVNRILALCANRILALKVSASKKPAVQP